MTQALIPEADQRAIAEAVDTSLKLWRRHPIGFLAFQPLVELELGIVEDLARQLVADECSASGLRRQVTLEDRRRAACAIVKRAISMLRPRPPLISTQEDQALGVLPAQKWPDSLPIPDPARLYLVMCYAHLWGGKSNREIARILGYHCRMIPNFRRQAAAEMAGRIFGWEQCRYVSGASPS